MLLHFFLNGGLMIPIFLSSDSNYAPYLMVVIKSVCENTKSNIKFYILDDGIEDSIKEVLRNQIANYGNCDIEFISVEFPNIFSDCIVVRYLSKTAYVRLLIPDLKPELDKIIYLDIDLVVNMDIAELFNQDLDEYIIGAEYEEHSEEYHSVVSKKNLGLDEKHKYFNSGVLLIDCEKWRKNNITNILKDAYIRCVKGMTYHDQDLLNIVFSPNKYLSLDKKFNYFSINSYTENKNMIIHYAGDFKAWQFLPDLKTDIISYKDIWWKYAKDTEYFETIKSKCIYKDEISLRVARAKNAHILLNMSKVKQMYKQNSCI